MKISAVWSSFSSAAKWSACLRSSTMLRLFRFFCRNAYPMPSCLRGVTCLVVSPDGASTLITSAP